jgi:small subunit ribosomal protein S2
MMTNFATIRRSVKKMQSIEKLLGETNENITKKERLVLSREKNKMEKVLNGVAMLNRLPAAIFIVDVEHEHIAVFEAKKLNITTFAMVDTNSDPNDIDFPVPANDDATKSIEIITRYLGAAVMEGLEERKKDKEASPDEEAEEVEAGEEGGEEEKREDGSRRSRSGRRTMRPGAGPRERTTNQSTETGKQ